jgi:hypothetical protein
MKLSDIIQSLLEKYDTRPLALSTVLECTGEQGFGIISGILTLPMLIPIPVPLPGFSTLMGVGIIWIGLQLAFGLYQPSLPARIARLELSPAASQKVLKHLNRLLRPIEKLARSRLPQVSHNPLLHRFLGVCLAWNAALMALPLPIPFTNLAPAYTILVLTIGMLETDGLFLLIGYGMTTATTIFFASITHVIWALFLHLIGR